MKIINLREGDAIASVMAVPKSEDNEVETADTEINAGETASGISGETPNTDGNE